MTNAEDTEVYGADGLRNLEETNVVQLKLLQGGKGRWDGNWLSKLELFSMFVARRKGQKAVDWNLYYLVFSDLPEVMMLQWRLPDGKVLDEYVDPQRFSNQMELGKVLGVDNPLELRKAVEEINNDSNERDRTDLSSDVEDDAPAS